MKYSPRHTRSGGRVNAGGVETGGAAVASAVAVGVDAVSLVGAGVGV